jgi:hypothetical protein
LCARARITLGDGLVVGTLGSVVTGNRGWSFLIDGVPVVGGGGGTFCWNIGRRILRSCWMVRVLAMDSLVEEGTVPPRVVSVFIAWMIVRSVSEIIGVARIKLPRVRHTIPSGTRHVETQVLGMF